jgi:lipopolysaccharide export system protein LptA
MAAGLAALRLSSGKDPINIKSEKLQLDYEGRSVIFSGHVRATQSGSQLTSDSLRVNYGADFRDVKEMIASGNVRISQGTRWATGDHAVLDQTRHTVTLTGSPVVHDGEDQIAGTKITVHLDTNQSDVENARAVIFPHESKLSLDGSGGGDESSPAPPAQDRPSRGPASIEGSMTEGNP